MAGNGIEGLTIAEAARRIAARDLSPVELIEAQLARIEAVDPRIDSFVTVMAESAKAEARAAEEAVAARRRRSPLHGIPIGLKDIYDTAGVRTAGGSRTAIDRVPAEDAATVAALRRAGAVILGKLTTHEFAHGGPSFDLPWPPARNPWNRDHFTGGSSSGSGAAVAAGLCLGALGTDTGGSIRGPAALSGVAGLKPTYGLVSRRGVIPNSFTFDHCGPLAWTSEDCALLLGALAGHDPADPASADRASVNYEMALGVGVRGLRVGLLRHFWEEDLAIAPAMVAATEQVAAVLAAQGATVETARIAPAQDWYDVKIVIAESELFNVHRGNLLSRPHDFGTDFLARSLGALLFGAQDYVAAQRRRRQLMASMRPVYERFDLLVCPGAAGPAPRLDAHRTQNFWRTPSITTPFNVTGGPALTVCAGFSDTGLPLGVQIVGRPFEDAVVLRAGHAFERATAWRDRRPVVEPGPRPDDPVPELPSPVDELDAPTRARVEALAAAAGLPLDDKLMSLLAEAAPFAFAMGDRLRRDYAYADEPWGLRRP